MATLDLSPIETRVLGCLLEKERTVPESYPLTLNSLITACNQTTNRDPVTAFDEKTVEHGIAALRDKKLVTALFGSGSRVQKYRHNILDHFTLDRRDVSVIAVLLLRGPQTAGELRGRTERLFHFATLEELETCLAGLQAGDSPLIHLLPQQPGQKERRYVQLLSAEPEGGWQISTVQIAPPLRTVEQTQSLEAEIAGLRAELAELREQFAAFKKQFE